MKPTPSTASFLQGGGEMGRRIRELDWSQTPLGKPEQWQQSLKTAVRIMLTSRQPMWIAWGEDLTYLYNDAYQAILGGKHPEMLGQPTSVVWSEIWDEIEPRTASVMLRNEATYDESLLLIMERNGYPEETYYTFSYSPIPDDQGGTGGIICANTDNTQQVIGERQLALLRVLATKTADARTFDEACTFSAQCLAINPYDLPFALLYLIDVEQQQVILSGTAGIDRGHPLAPETVGFDQDSIWRLSEVVRSQKPAIITNLPADLPYGAWQHPPHQAIVMPIVASGDTGKAGILVAGLNPFRLLDDNYQGFLELVSGQIAASIANAQAYEEERKRAETLAELDRAKTVFFNNISHEFRTPLTLMLSPTEEALNDPIHSLSPVQRERIEIVQRNGMRLLKLVNTLLDFSRIEAGRVQAVYEPTDLASFTTDLASVFRSTIERANLRFVVDCPELPEVVYVDHEMWEKIVLNLLSNAFKFTFEGKITVQLRWLTDQVQLIVRDTGIGIPAAEIPHLFERFHRVKASQGRSFEGSGIGLSLVQELVKLHQGTIAVMSQEGEGTCFTIAIPTGTAHLPAERISETRTASATGASSYVEEALRWLPDSSSAATPLELNPVMQSSSPQAYILLADDNADMRDYVRRLLAQQYEVKAVSDGLAVLDAVSDRAPDLVLTDVMMPQLDGFGVLSALRNDPQTREIPIILLSARAGEEARVEGLAAGADDYLTKPFSARELLARVEATLKLSKLRQEAIQREQALRAASETAQQQAETALKRIDQLLERMSDAFVALDHHWTIIYQNATAERINNKPRSEVLGKTLWEEWPAAIGTEIERQYRRAIAEQTAVHFEHHYYEPPNHDVWLEVNAYPFEEGLGIFYRDISERKQLEAEQTHILQLEQIAREKAEQANRIKDEFLAVLSHELRSPLNPILGWSKLLQTGKLDAEKTAYALATIERNAKLQSDLIADLLDVSRILQGKINLNVSTVNLATVIRAAIETVRLAAEAKSIEIKTAFESEIVDVAGDATRLQQIVWNLLSNAVKFTPAGGRVQIHLTSIDHQVQMTVQDTGKGIAPDFLPYVFDYFRQEDGATTRQFGGLGLGLAIVRYLTELHGGTVAVESPGEGQGATFMVQLPRLSTASNLQSEAQSSDSSSSLQDLKVLVVDDDLDALGLVEFLLEEAGAIVVPVSSGREALAALARSRFDIRPPARISLNG
jgi:PAS domain S-box-containing protein